MQSFMSKLNSIEELNWALKIYSDIVKYGEGSSLLHESKSCLKILESFEEYEKCEELYRILTKKKDPRIPLK